jgi:YidC/Oxa1 family membrane protein insertase
VQARSADSVTFAAGPAVLTITLKDNYQIEVKETFQGVPESTPTRLSLGIMSRSAVKSGAPTGDLSIDSYATSLEKPGVVHWNDADHPLKHDLSSASGGCSCSRRSVQGLALTSTNHVDSASRWIAVKNDYFVAALLNGSEDPAGFTATVTRDAAAETYVPQSVAAAASFASLKAERAYTLYVGPKKQALLWDLGLKDVMDFGMWRWLCYGMVWVLNLFYSMVPSYGVAIILLTILVRILFWPLTHKSTIGMRKMQEIQPLLKEIQAKYKGNPQRLQQETWQLYREHKVNPLSSCLPMLIQIPVFFALFVVLRGAVELRYAPFLWIKDLSQPEALFASWFPFGGLNILPILMAVTMALQSALTPSTGDKSQQRMMMLFMPLMMLVMFYNFASALSLYWTLSQVMSIAQAWWIRKKYGTPSKPAGKDGVIEPDAVEMPQTRQMRRHP